MTRERVALAMMQQLSLCKIVQQPVADLTEYSRIPIAFTVDRILEVTTIENGLGGLILQETPLDCPYIKDYDAIEGNSPESWAARWDLSNWGMISALANGKLIGGAVLAFGTDALDLLDKRTDLTLIWDLRVHPDYRHQGVGQDLFRAAEAWARARRCLQIKVETQNINVPACRFYRKQGCVLGAMNRHAYPAFPTEVQLLWYKSLN
jgi:GNAT superfamily N-acetyltransferase